MAPGRCHFPASICIPVFHVSSNEWDGSFRPANCSPFSLPRMAALASWHPDDVTFQPEINKSQTARDYLRRSWDRGGSTTSTVVSNIGQMGAGPAQVVDRLYACQDKVRIDTPADRQSVSQDTGSLIVTACLR